MNLSVNRALRLNKEGLVRLWSRTSDLNAVFLGKLVIQIWFFLGYFWDGIGVAVSMSTLNPSLEGLFKTAILTLTTTMASLTYV